MAAGKWALGLLLTLFLFPGNAPRAGAEELPCLMCHEDLTKAAYLHPAAALGCEVCHLEPHAKDKAELSLVLQPPDLCLQCHDSKPFNLKVRHAPVAKGSCLACHEAHSSAVSVLLKAPIGDLCTACHKPEASGRHVLAGLGLRDAHPLKGFPDPNKSGRELSCLSCHQPHAAGVARLFVADAASPRKLCLVCHEKVRMPLY